MVTRGSFRMSLTHRPLRRRPGGRRMRHRTRVPTFPEEVERHHKSQDDSARDGECRSPDSLGSGDSQSLVCESLVARIGEQYQGGEPDCGADSRTRRNDSRGNALLAIWYPCGRRDEHRCEHDTVADAEGDETWDEHGVGTLWRHRETHRDSADCTDGERGSKGARDAEARHRATGEG